MPSLMKGYIDRFAPDNNAHDLSFEGWLRVCTNALVLARLARSAGGRGRSQPETFTPDGTALNGGKPHSDGA